MLMIQSYNFGPKMVYLDKETNGKDMTYALEEIVGNREIPFAFVNGKYIGSTNDEIQEASKDGTIDRLLNEAGARRNFLWEAKETVEEFYARRQAKFDAKVARAKAAGNPEISSESNIWSDVEKLPPEECNEKFNPGIREDMDEKYGKEGAKKLIA